MISLPFQLQPGVQSRVESRVQAGHEPEAEADCLLTKIFLLSLQNHRLSNVGTAPNTPAPLADRILQMERSLSVELQGKNKRIQSLASEIIHLKDQIIKLQTNANTSSSLISSLKLQLAHANQIIANLKSQPPTQVDKFTILNREHTQLKEEYGRCRDENIRMKEDNIRVREEYGKCRVEYSKVDKECHKVRQECEGLKSQVRQLGQQLNTRPTVEQYTRIQNKLREYDQQYMHYSKEMSQTTSTVNSLKGTITTLQQALERQKKENAGLRNMGDMLLERVKAYQCTIKQMEIDCRKLQQQNKEYKQGYQQDRIAYQQATEEAITRQQQETRKAMKQRDDAIMQWQSLMKELSNQKQIINTLQSELDNTISIRQQSSIINSARGGGVMNTNNNPNTNNNVLNSNSNNFRTKQNMNFSISRQLEGSKELKLEKYNQDHHQRSYQDISTELNLHIQSNLMEKMLDADSNSRYLLQRKKGGGYRSVDKFQKYLSFQLPTERQSYASTNIKQRQKQKQREYPSYTDVKVRPSVISRVSSEQRLRPSYSSTQMTAMNPTPSLYPSNSSTARVLDQNQCIPTIADQKKMLMDKLNNMNLTTWDHRKKIDISTITKGRGKLQIKGRADLLKQKQNIHQLIYQKYPRP